MLKLFLEHGFTKEEDGVGILLKGRKEKLLKEGGKTKY